MKLLRFVVLCTFIKASRTKPYKAAGVSFPLHNLKFHRDLLSLYGHRHVDEEKEEIMKSR